MMRSFFRAPGNTDALIGLFRADCTEFTTENAILTATSAEDGSFSFSRVPYGNWIVREIEAPTGFVLSEKSYPVTVDADGAVIEVEIENTRIRGTVQLTKTDRDYPDNKLTGAEFTVYRDSNGNKELDADDELLGTLTETGIGVYEMADLLYGGYFVKETKAPEGFYLDGNAYYFEITEDGKIVTVENEAGKGFVNAPQVGSLKIIKTSSDGKIEGFSFRVTGPNGYVGVFTTDKNGEIIIENLRIGEYVVSEVSDGHLPLMCFPPIRRHPCLKERCRKWRCTTSFVTRRKPGMTAIPPCGLSCSAFPLRALPHWA